MKRGLRQQIDRTIQTLLKMVDIHSTWNHVNNNVPANQIPMVVIGKADFGQGTNSIHEKIASEIALKFKAMGLFVFLVDEYNTSQMCPCCEQFTRQIKFRVKYCENCNRFYHRDVMAGENMAIIGRELARVNGGNIPIRLRRPIQQNQQPQDMEPPDRPPHLMQ